MATDTSTHWSALRAQIPVTERVRYFNAGWSGPLPTPVVEAMEARLRREWADGPTAKAVVDETLATREALIAQIARLVNAEPEEIAATRNTTDGMNIVINGLEWDDGDVVVTTSVEHSSGAVPVYYLQQRHGVVPRFVPASGADSPGEILERFSAALAGGVKLVVISHISYSTGQVFPLEEIVRLTHDAGGRVLVDGAQTFGQIPLDMHGSRVDYYAFPGHKWLLGPDGLGALYIRGDLIQSLQPRAVAGRAAQGFDHAGGGFVPETASINKFMLTSMSAPVTAGMKAALDFYETAGPREAWERVCAQGRRAAEALADVPGVRLLSPSIAEAQSGLVSFAARGWADPKDLSDALQERYGIVCRSVAELGAVRWSLHYFNDDEEIDAAVEAVRDLVRG